MSENDDGLHQIIELLSETDLCAYLSKIRDDLQVTKLSHFQYVQSSDLERIGLSKPSIRRLFAAIKQKQRNQSKKISQQKSFLQSNSNSNSTSSLISPSSLILSEILGEGHYGIVRRAQWNDFSVAVKILRGCHNLNEFIQETNAMHQLSHRYLLRLHGIVLSQPLMMVTELAPLGSLANRLRTEPKTFLLSMLIEYSIQISEGMNYLEQQRFIHRDLAARNIFLMSYEQIKIGDFGLARMIDLNNDLYKTENVGGQSIAIAWCAPESLRYQQFSSSSDVWMFAVTLWEMFTLAVEQPWKGFSLQQILNALEKRGERLRCPDLCSQSIYKLLLNCWSLDCKDRPKFGEINQYLNQCRLKQYRVIKDHKEINHLTLLRGDTITILHSSSQQILCKGQNHRTHQVGLFPRNCLSSSSSSNSDKSHENISWPLRGSFIHTAHSDPNGKDKSWGKIDQIDETILNNPIVDRNQTNCRSETVQSKNLFFVERIVDQLKWLVVPNVLQLNGRIDHQLITRPPPSIPQQRPILSQQSTTNLSEDLFLIDLSSSPPKPNEEKVLQDIFSSPTKSEEKSSDINSGKCSTDSFAFVAKVVNGVTEELKNDFPRLNSSNSRRDYTPPLIRRFTIPYPNNSNSFHNVPPQN